MPLDSGTCPDIEWTGLLDLDLDLELPLLGAAAKSLGLEVEESAILSDYDSLFYWWF